MKRIPISDERKAVQSGLHAVLAQGPATGKSSWTGADLWYIRLGISGFCRITD